MINSEQSKISNKKTIENLQNEDMYFKNLAELSSQMNVESRLDPTQFNQRVYHQNLRSKSVTPCLNTANSRTCEALARNQKYHLKQVAKIIEPNQFNEYLNVRGVRNISTPNQVRIVFGGKIDESHQLIDKFKTQLNSRESKKVGYQLTADQRIKTIQTKGVGTHF